MRRFVLATASIPALALTFCFSAPPQQQPAPRGDHAAPSRQEPAQEKKGKKSQDLLATQPVFSTDVANKLLNDLRDGLEGHSRRLMLSAFDPDKMAGYASFEDQVQALFEKYDSFRVHYHIAQSTIEDSKGVALVDFELEEIPRAGAPPLRRSGSLRFEMERGRKGWKIVDFTPRGFFS